MIEKLKMIEAVAVEKAVRVSEEMNGLDTGSCELSRAVMDLKSLMKTAHIACEMIHTKETK